MKRIFEKTIVISMIILFILGSLSIAKKNEKNNLRLIEESEAHREWEKLPEDERKNTLEPWYFNININKSIKKSVYNNLLRARASGETSNQKYDLREDLTDRISVRDQKGAGSCWAFAFISSLETNATKKLDSTKKYSTMHLDYMTSKMFNRNVGDGGNALLGISYSTSGKGPVYESELTFEEVYDENENREPYYLKDISEVNLNQIPKARVKDATFFANIYKNKTSDNIVYKSDVGEDTTYSSEEVEIIRQTVKNKIKENGGVTAALYFDVEYSDGKYVSQGGYYDEANKSYYCNDYNKEANHSVTIVGWDDTYSKTKFTPNAINDGAYIVLNSYGTDFGENGYFYVSYDDSTIEQYLIGIDSIEEFKENDNGIVKTYDNIYQYDELGMATYFLAENLDTNSIYVANVFETKEKEKIEYLTEVGLFIADTMGVEVYVLPVDDELPSIEDLGEAVATRTTTNALEAGYHTIELSSPEEITEDKFAVIVKYMKDGEISIPIDCDLKASKFVDISNYFDKSVSNPGESFIYTGSSDDIWSDLYNYQIEDEGNVITLVGANACIKAFTVSTDEEKKIDVTGVSLDKNTYSMSEGDKTTLVATITPENATNQNVVWSSSNEEVATVSETGVITAIKEGTAEITVKTIDGEFSDTCELTVTKKVNKDDDIYQDKPSSDDDNIDNNKVDDTNIVDGDNEENTTIVPEKGENFKDKTTATGGLPFTGIKIIGVSLIIISIIGIFMYKKYKNLKEIK